MTQAHEAAPFSGWERAVASRYLRTKRRDGGIALISVISFVGILLAVAVLIIVMSVMNGFRAELLGRILGFNGHAYVAGEILADARRDGVVQRVRAISGVRQATPLIEAQAMAIGRGQIAGAMVRGIARGDLEATQIIASNIKQGSLRGFDTGDDGGDIVLIGTRLADSLGVGVGDAVTLISPTGAATAFGNTPRQKDYTIGGLFSVGMSEYDQAFIYMPLRQAQLFFGRNQAVDVIEIHLDNPDLATTFLAKIRSAAGPGAFVSDWTDKNQSYFNALKVERNTMRLILMMLVAIAALNIISGLVMLVKNKSRDIAILRTIGASRGSILRIFFMAGAAIGVSGTLAGLLLGVLFCTYISEIQQIVEWVTGTAVFSADVYFLSHVPAKIEWREVLGIAGWSVQMSFAATLLPAWWASRLDPVEALRNE